MLSTLEPLLLVIVNNHFDLTWRRCWEKPFHYHGKTFVSYTDLQAWYMLDNIALAEKNPGYKFEAESTQVARKFIERCPEMLPVLQQLAREGRFAVTGGGEAIIDANMVTGESLIRNYVDGLLWVEETFGQKTRMAVRNDAFGNSAQLPQILRGVEIAWVTGNPQLQPCQRNLLERAGWQRCNAPNAPNCGSGRRRHQISALPGLQR